MIVETANVDNPTYSGNDLLAAIEKYCLLYDVDVAAVMSVAASAGLNGNVSPGGYGYGPLWIDLRSHELPQLGEVKPYDAKLNTWAWSDSGIQYAIRRMWQRGASGLTNGDAIEAIIEALYPSGITDDFALDVASMYVRILNDPVVQVPVLSQTAAGPASRASGIHASSANNANLNATLTGWENFKNSAAHKIPKFSADMTNIGKSIERLVKQ